jgi:hypothetical protein
MDVAGRLPKDLQSIVLDFYWQFYVQKYTPKILGWFKKRRLDLLKPFFEQNIPSVLIKNLRSCSATFDESYHRHYELDKPYYVSLPKLDSFLTYVILTDYDLF